jgi:hypothetical protein
MDSHGIPEECPKTGEKGQEAKDMGLFVIEVYMSSRLEQVRLQQVQQFLG